jgi:hypothetical protein
MRDFSGYLLGERDAACPGGKPEDVTDRKACATSQWDLAIPGSRRKLKPIAGKPVPLDAA